MAFHENKSPKGFRETAIRFLWVRKKQETNALSDALFSRFMDLRLLS